MTATVLVHLAAGIGNIVFATPMLCALARGGYSVDVLLDGDYPETADLLRDWSVVRTIVDRVRVRTGIREYLAVVPACPPFYWPKFSREFAALPNVIPRPPDALFREDEQQFYLEFARHLGCPVDSASGYLLPIVPDDAHGIGSGTLVLAPGCKTGEMAAKRWPRFVQLADGFDDVVVVGTADDLRHFDGTPMRFPTHVRMLVGQLTLRQTAGVLAAAGVVVANDSGLGHVAGAVGTPTILLFGPTPDRALGHLPDNVRVMRSGLPCEPCWFRERFRACARRIDCLQRLTVEQVAAEVRARLVLPADGVEHESARSLSAVP